MHWFEARRDPANAVVALDHVGPPGAGAWLVVDQGHGFFYDHPLDHVPGLLLIEAASQLARHWADATGRGELALTRLSVRFLKYCLHGAPVEMTLRPRPMLGPETVSIALRQANVTRAKFVLTLGAEPPVTADRRLPPGLAGPGAGDPADSARLGKRNPANVMITTPVPLGGDSFARLLAAAPGNLLADPVDAAAWHPLYLLEAWMQMLRFARSAPGARHGRMRDILAGIELDLCGPARRGEDIGLIVGGRSHDTGRWLSRNGVIGTADRVLARVVMLTARPSVPDRPARHRAGAT